MEVKQIQFHHGVLNAPLLKQLYEFDPDLVMLFSDKEYFCNPALVSELLTTFPDTSLVGVSTAGELSNQGVHDGSCVVSAVRFAQGSAQVETCELPDPRLSNEVGRALGEKLCSRELRGVLLFAPGLAVDGSALLAGLHATLPSGIPVVGGLAWDAQSGQNAMVLSGAGTNARQVVAVGLHGNRIRVHAHSRGGWTPFGPMRRVTRCDGDLLLGLDGEPALRFYSRYLGEYARELPESGLRFPFEMHPSDQPTDPGLIRTVIGVDRERDGLRLGGQIHPDAWLRLMHVTSSKLVNGAGQAAAWAAEQAGESPSGLGILISCVGRKLIMGEQIADELEEVHERLGRRHTVAGFYAHGEIGPMGLASECALHNQTMTVALIVEEA